MNKTARTDSLFLHDFRINSVNKNLITLDFALKSFGLFYLPYKYIN